MFSVVKMEDDFYDPLSTPWKEANFNLKYFWAVFVALTAIATFFANALVVLAVWKDPNRNLQRAPSNLLIASQAVADFFVGLVQEPLCAWWILTFSSKAVHSIEAVSSLFLVSSLLHVVALSFDRYIAVAKPLQYSASVTKKRVFVWILIIWLSSSIYMSYRTVLRELNYSIVLINVISGVHTVLPSISSVFFTFVFIASWEGIGRAPPRATLTSQGDWRWMLTEESETWPRRCWYPCVYFCFVLLLGLFSIK